MQAETKFKNKLRPFLEAIPKSWWVKVQQVSISGTPDFLGCVNGRFVALELKKSYREDPSPIQTYNIDKITEADGLAFVVNPQNYKDILLELNSLSVSLDYDESSYDSEE